MKLCISTLTCIFLYFTCLCASAAETAQVPKLPVQKIKPGTFSGALTDTSGKTLVNKKVEILDAKGNVIASTVSDGNGLFKIPNLPEGMYTMRVNNTDVAKLDVTKTAAVTSMRTVMPSPATAFTPLQWTLIGVGGAAVAVGVPVTIHNINDSSSNTVSP